MLYSQPPVSHKIFTSRDAEREKLWMRVAMFAHKNVRILKSFRGMAGATRSRLRKRTTAKIRTPKIKVACTPKETPQGRICTIENAIKAIDAARSKAPQLSGSGKCLLIIVSGRCPLPQP
jgi:hypothetical protein